MRRIDSETVQKILDSKVSYNDAADKTFAVEVSAKG